MQYLRHIRAVGLVDFSVVAAFMIMISRTRTSLNGLAETHITIIDYGAENTIRVAIREYRDYTIYGTHINTVHIRTLYTVY